MSSSRLYTVHGYTLNVKPNPDTLTVCNMQSRNRAAATVWFIYMQIEKGGLHCRRRVYTLMCVSQCIHFWGKWVKTRKQDFALNMDNFYLASELSRGENCHILAVAVLGESPRTEQAGGFSQKCMELLRTAWAFVPKSTSTSEQQLFSSDKCTSEWQNHKREKTKMCTDRSSPARCIM